jgi:hypothetical protein
MIEALRKIALDQEHKADRGNTFMSVGIREAPVWLKPILHELLGPGNDLMSNFGGHVEEGVEPLKTDEIEAQNTTQWQAQSGRMWAWFGVIHCGEATTEWVSIKTMLTSSKWKEINEQKKELIHLERSTCKRKRDKSKKKARELKRLFDTMKATQSDIQKKGGQAEKTLANSIQSEVLNLFKVHLSNFGSWPNVSAIVWCIFATADKTRNNIQSGGDAQGAAGTGTTEMGLSMTPKWHMLLNHATELLIRARGGLIEMGKNQIKHAYQLQWERDHLQCSCLPNFSKMKASQAKYQNLKLHPEIIKLTQATVQEKSKQNFKGKVLLAKENLDSARATRNKIRDSILKEVMMDEDRILLLLLEWVENKSLKGVRIRNKGLW